MQAFSKITVFCSVVVLGAGLVAARPGPDGPRRGHGPQGGRLLAAALDLTDEQQAEMRSIRERHMSDSLGDPERVAHRARGEMRRLVRDPAVDEQAVLDAARRASAASEQVALARHRMHLELHAVLTDEQRAKAESLGDEWPGGDGPRFRDGMHERRRGPGTGDRLAAVLDLTDEQRAQTAEIFNRYAARDDEEDGEGARGLREARRDLRRAVRDASSTEQDVRDAAVRVSSEEEMAALSRHRMVVELDGVLTAEQRNQLAEIREQRGPGAFPGGRHGRPHHRR